MTTEIERYHERGLFGSAWDAQMAQHAEKMRPHLRKYIARRQAKGDTIEIVKDVYVTGRGNTRAVLTINGTQRALIWLGGWRYAAW